MSLDTEWRARIDRWREALAEQLYQPLREVEVEGFTTTDHLRPEEAARGDFEPMPPGTPWGAKWEYAWFRTSLTVPEQAAGRRLELRLELGGPSLIYLDGVLAGGRDGQHRSLTLATEAEAGATYGLLAEAYAWHGPTPCDGGPVPEGTEPVPEPTATQRTVGRSTFGVWEEQAYQLWIDVETLLHLRDNLDSDSLRVAEIDEGLRDFTRIVDLELPREQMLQSIRRGRERLRPLLECHNGSTAPELYAFGHAHLDTAWLWPLAQTRRKAARTLANALSLMEQYPRYKFLHSQPELYRMVKEHYPRLYGRVQEAVADGRIIAEGSTWVEMDTNVTGGESLVRQFLYGKQFYRREFGVETELMWLPDVFGYSGALPQIMRGCGVRYFSTAKIFWNYYGGDPFPHNTFTWEGIDGSSVLVHLCNDYNSQTRPSDLIRRWRERRQKDGLRSRLLPFGWGDGGGGPTRDHLEYLGREDDLEGVPRTRIASPIEYYKDLESRGVPDVNYVGELYYQCHRGTYTSQARSKRGNRKSEFALREAEMWGTAAAALAEAEFPAGRIREAWRRILVNQFHDILPGSSIRRVYQEAEADYARTIEEADTTARQAQQALTKPTDGALTVFNSLSWARRSPVELPDGWEGAESNDGTPLTVQQLGDGMLAEAEVPACGWTTIRPAALHEADAGAKATERSLENDLLRVEVNQRGEVSGIYDKEADRELAAGVCNALRMYKDVPSRFDAWDIDSMYEDTPVDLPEPARIEVVAAGPLVATLRIERRIHDSDLTQQISLRRRSRRVEFRTTVDWQEKHKLLKVNFPVQIHATEGIHEIQYGHLRRPNHASRQFDADRYEVAQQKWTALAEGGRGFAVLNDCKYGVSVDGNSINLTLLRAPLRPDGEADLGRQEFTYAFYAWNGSLADSGVVREGYELNVPVTTADGDAGQRSLFCVDAPNVVIDAAKPAEDGSGDIIVRLYEAKRAATRCALTTSLPIAGAEQTNLLEETEQELETGEGRIALSFRPFEIKTVRLKT